VLDIIGYIGAFIVTYSNIPQVILFFKHGDARGISIPSTWLGLLGVCLRGVYLALTTSFNLIVLFPYFFSIGCLFITLYYCYFPSNIKYRRKYENYKSKKNKYRLLK